jgi:ubiquinone biosynthesis protein COQ4
MSLATTPVEAAPRLRREWGKGLRALGRFITTPSDLANSFDAMFSLAGPTVQREFDRFAADPVGARLLAMRPRPDLNALLLDRAALAAMPEGSFGRAYLDYLGGEGMGAADYFLEAANLEESAERFGWSEDHLWFVRRMTNSHDLYHVLAGYDRDVTGEVGIIAFTAGQLPLLPLKLLLPYLFVLYPSRPIAWGRYVRAALRHGRETPPLAHFEYEALLALPLDEVRQRIGMRSAREVHARGIPEAGVTLRGLEQRVDLV